MKKKKGDFSCDQSQFDDDVDDDDVLCLPVFQAVCVCRRLSVCVLFHSSTLFVLLQKKIHSSRASWADSDNKETKSKEQ